MSLIPYPDVPNYSGVPPVPRVSAGSPGITLKIASQQSSVLNNTSVELPWGIYTQANQPIYAPTDGGTLSVLSFGFTRAMSVSNFPIEANNTNQGAAFASFNKVYQPANPVVTLALSGTEGEKIAFLAALDAACQSTELFNVYTPDASYSGSDDACTIERYNYQRSATHGATMLIVEVSLKQIRQVSASLTNTSIPAPQSPSASSQVNNGITQSSTPPTSWLAQILGGNTVGVQ
jgi:hypothetical protein